MNILFLIKDYSVVGGIQTVTRTLIKYFINKGINIHILSNEIKTKDIEDIIYIELPDRSDFSTEINKEFIEEYSIKNNINIILNQGVFFYKKINVPPHIKTIATLHSSPYWELNTFRHKILNNPKLSIKSILKKLLYYPFFIHKYKYIIKNIYRTRIKNHDIFVTLDENYTNTLKKDYPEYKDKFYNIQNPLIYDNYDEGYIKHKENIILFVGSLTNSVKRVNNLLSIWRNIEHKNKKWRLVIIGDGKDKENLIKLKSKFNLRNIEFVGYKNPIPFYKKAKILCLTSEFEGLPMVIIESQIYGCVPLSNNCCDALYNIMPSIDLIIKKNNNKLFTEKLKDLISDQEHLNKLSKESIIKSRNFNIEIIGEQWFDLFNELDRI